MIIRKHYLARLAVVLVGVMTLVAAMSSLASAAKQAKVPPHPDTVTIADFAPGAAFAPLYAAFGKTGAFAAVEKKYHTDIKTTTLASPTDDMNAVLGGAADIAQANFQQYAAAQAAGKDVVVTFAPYIGGGGVLIGAKKYEQSRGTDLSKYDGATFGIPRVGSTSEGFLKVALERSGVTYKNQNVIAFGTITAGIGVLEAGRADLVAVDPNTASQAINAGTAYLVLNFNDPKTAYPIVGQQLVTTYGFLTSFTQKYPELAKDITLALKEGLDAVKKAGTNADKVLKLFPAETQALVKDGWAGQWKLVGFAVNASDGTIPARALNDTLTFNQSNGFMTPAQLAAGAKIVDNTYLTGKKEASGTP